MNILHLDSGRQLRGGQWQVLLLMQALSRRGHRQQLLARPGSPLLERARRAGFAAEPSRLGWRLASRSGFPADLIHAHDAASHTAAVLRRRRAPLVVSRRVSFPVGRGWLSRWKYARAAHYIAVSHYVARQLRSVGIPQERIAVVLDGVSLPVLTQRGEQRAAFRRRWNLPAEAFVAGTLTSLREKPILPLLEAAEVASECICWSRPAIRQISQPGSEPSPEPATFTSSVLKPISPRSCSRWTRLCTCQTPKGWARRRFWPWPTACLWSPATSAACRRLCSRVKPAAGGEPGRRSGRESGKATGGPGTGGRHGSPGAPVR